MQDFIEKKSPLSLLPSTPGAILLNILDPMYIFLFEFDPQILGGESVRMKGSVGAHSTTITKGCTFIHGGICTA